MGPLTHIFWIGVTYTFVVNDEVDNVTVKRYGSKPEAMSTKSLYDAIDQ